MQQDQAPDSFFSAQTMGILMWILFTTLLVNIAVVFGSQFWGAERTFETLGEFFRFGTRVLMTTLPTLILAWAIFDLATFFKRCEDGEVFTSRNIKTLRSAGESLFAVAIISALVTPTIIGWMDHETRSLVWQSNDLTLGVAAMGIGLFGFANIFAEAVALQVENDAFV